MHADRPVGRAASPAAVRWTSRATPRPSGWFCRTSRPLLAQGPRPNAAPMILAAVGYNFRLVLAWLRAFLRSSCTPSSSNSSPSALRTGLLGAEQLQSAEVKLPGRILVA